MKIRAAHPVRVLEDGQLLCQRVEDAVRRAEGALVELKQTVVGTQELKTASSYGALQPHRPEEPLPPSPRLFVSHEDELARTCPLVLSPAAG